MDNIDMSVDGSILTVKIDLTKQFGRSSSGKTTVVASTRGNQDVGYDNVKIGINAYKK